MPDGGTTTQRSRTRARVQPRRKAHAAALPARFRPQLALLVKTAPDGDAWLHEIKLDGYRIGCRVDDGAAHLLSRNGNDWTKRFPTIAKAAASLPVKRALFDGEVAVVLDDGRTSFQALQNAYAGAPAAGHIVYFVFDLLHLDGDDVARLPLEERKQRLAAVLSRAKRDGPIRYGEHVVGQGDRFLAQACKHGLEGIVSKRRDAAYAAGRGATWVKTKCVKRQEFVIGGFTDPEGSRAGIGALLLGVHDRDGALVFAGKVGTGFTQARARELRARLDTLERRDSPFAVAPPARLVGRPHWVRPTLVAEVAFSEWTADGRIRHPSFQGLRSDKPAKDIIHELAAEPPKASPSHHSDGAVVAGVALSHPERVLYPDVGITKIELARFYVDIADWVLPHVTGRPLTLVRCPNGIGASCFFMKHSGAWTPAGIRRVRIQEKTKIGEYLVADDLTALVTLVQANVVELHTWNATVDRIERPDRVVLDLDPGPDVRWKDVVDAARLVRAAVQEIGLVSFVKTTGGRGLHVVIPLTPVANWRVGLDFARAVADAVARLSPTRYTTTFAKAGRERKILIDYMRNGRLSTSVAAYSPRARPGAPVSTPITWEELEDLRSPAELAVRSLVQRLQRLKADPWADYWKCKQQIPAAAVKRLATVKP